MGTPTDSKLYNRIKKRIYKQNPVHSAYRSGMIVSQYKKAFKKKYGDDVTPYIGKKPQDGLSRWYKEEWKNQRGEVGYKYKSDVYRPTKRITKKTPKTCSELSLGDIQKARNKKYKTGRVNKF